MHEAIQVIIYLSWNKQLIPMWENTHTHILAHGYCVVYYL